MTTATPPPGWNRNDPREWAEPPRREKPRRSIGGWIVKGLAIAGALLIVLVVAAVACAPSATPPPAPSSVPGGAAVTSSGPVAPYPGGAVDEDGGQRDSQDENRSAAAPKFGTTVDSDGVQITPTAPKASKDAIGAYFCTNVTYVNNSDSPVDFNAYQWKLTDSEGVETSPTIGGPGKYLGTGSVNPGGRKSGDICFDKEGAGVPASLSYQGGIFSGTTVWVA